jgi:uncharacterized protein YlxW (UPF0749 family)
LCGAVPQRLVLSASVVGDTTDGEFGMAKAGTHARQRWPIAVLAVFVVTGYLFVAAGVSSDGTDLRPTGGDVASLLRERAQRIEDRRETARDLRSDIDELSSTVSNTELEKLQDDVDSLEPPTGLTPVDGPGVRVTLTDAPRSVDVPGLDPNVLVVHQQDIQAFVNALWAGGADAISLQGQRLISTTGIKCVGNTVVLDGVPYSPPYVIEAVGDTAAMNESLDASPEVTSYRRYADEYQLGLEVEILPELKLKGYAGEVSLSHARPAG